jgi:cathepsin A (carboxypeptidase C)
MGTGFSDGLPTTFTTKRAASDYYDFLQKFFGTFPQYRDLPFHIFGESYAGHYIPEFAYHFNEKNKEAKKEKDPDTHIINLKSVAIGNGLTDPLIQ